MNAAQLIKLRELVECSKRDDSDGKWCRYNILPEELARHAEALVRAAEKVASEQKELKL